MFTKHKIYYTIEVKLDDAYSFVCSYATFNEAKSKVDELKLQNDTGEYRILKIEKDIEEVS